MAKLPTKLNDAVMRGLPLPPLKNGKIQVELYWCAATPGFGVRVSSTGVKSWLVKTEVEGKDYKRTLGAASGTGAITVATARQLLGTLANELALGKDRKEIRVEAAKADKVNAVTLADAIKEYIAKKRRAKDGLPLKERYKADFLKTIQQGGVKASGEPYLNGHLYELANKSLAKITGDDMRRVYAASVKRSQAQADAAMRMLRAVLNWNGIFIDDSPLAKTTAGRKRIVLATPMGHPTPIPAEQLGAWWRAATQQAEHAHLTVSKNTADGLRLMLVTGLRPGEVFGSEFQAGIRVKDISADGRRLTSVDTKNRRDFTVLLSTQAQAILKKHSADKVPEAKVFTVADAGKTLEAINAAAGVDAAITPHKLRHTFTSLADELVSGYAVKHMINHINVGDVTGNNYVAKSDTQLRKAWQAVADYIEDSAHTGTRAQHAA